MGSNLELVRKPLERCTVSSIFYHAQLPSLIKKYALILLLV